MTKQEAIEILEEVKELDDSIYSYDSNYMEALEVAIEVLKEKKMQRLIDANAFLERTRKDPLFPLVERYGLSSVIEHEPTVEAIPVEWIEKWLDEFLGVKLEEEITDLEPFKKNVYQGILLMYNEWRRGDGK